MIVSSAVKLKDNRIFTGRRHGDVYKHMSEILKTPIDDLPLKSSIQGFLTDSGAFLNREKAYYHAYKCKQCDKQVWHNNVPIGHVLYVTEEAWKPSLASEHLWDGE